MPHAAFRMRLISSCARVRVRTRHLVIRFNVKRECNLQMPSRTVLQIVYLTYLGTSRRTTYLAQRHPITVSTKLFPTTAGRNFDGTVQVLVHAIHVGGQLDRRVGLGTSNTSTFTFTFTSTYTYHV